jgi:hypothetical protein
MKGAGMGSDDHDQNDGQMWERVQGEGSPDPFGADQDDGLPADASGSDVADAPPADPRLTEAE